MSRQQLIIILIIILILSITTLIATIASICQINKICSFRNQEKYINDKHNLFLNNEECLAIAAYIMRESVAGTTEGNWITYFTEINRRFFVSIDWIKENSELIEEYLLCTFQDIIIDCEITDDSFDVIVSSVFYEDDEDD